MDIVPTSSKRKRRIIVYDSVTRYGPQSDCQRKWPKREISIFIVLSLFI